MNERNDTGTAAFLTDELVRSVQRTFGTPVFVYDQRTLERSAAAVLQFANAFGMTARYAMKACPTAAVLRVLYDAGLHIDASSGYEVERAIWAGVAPERIQLTAQQLPSNLSEQLARGVLINACSLAQIHAIGAVRPGASISIRLNPGLGSGHSNRTNVGGPSASFGIWHEYLDEALEAARSHRLTVSRVHTHIGSGTDPVIWQRAALMTLSLCERIPEVTSLSLGGGFKVGRVAGETTVDLGAVGAGVVEAFRSFEARTGRRLHLEIEPGSYLVANAGALVATVIDLVDTGASGYRFVKVDAGMTENLRPSLYGGQHPIHVVPAQPDPARAHAKLLVVGHCCESGDVLTPAPGDPEGLAPRDMLEPRIGDALVMGGAGAYCSAMATKNYNSFPEASEVMLMTNGELTLIRKRQTLDQVVQNELRVTPPH